MSESTEKKMVRLRSSDGEVFEVEESVAKVAKTLQDMLEEDCADAVIPITCVRAPILTKVIDYCKDQVMISSSSSTTNNPNERTEQERKAWGQKFMEGVDSSTLCELLVASNFLNIEGLLNLGVDKMVSMIQGKYPQEIRDMFNVVNDFTPEEEEEIRNQNAWAFERDPYYKKRSSSK
ncbi:hypothetical protein H6P81_015509 [Aristolochia fimbriata]|uniref:SKP1-like protein n=1 Tax=Aristolochia fimbriata TaxID=158543 RepID=A0AAV7E5Y6_ARIFI|nr:hypothetical protein H6P81_015509 [Aristolochia fimbriata]